MRICIVYDCLFPYTVGGAERWYRNLAERLAGTGTRSPTSRCASGIAARTRRARRRRARGRRRGWRCTARRPAADPAAARFGARRARGTCSPRPPLRRRPHRLVPLLLAARRGARAAARAGFRLVVDWHEVWTREYWREYLGRLGGRVGWRGAAAAALRVPQRAFCFSRLHAAAAARRGDARRADGARGRSTPGPPAAGAAARPSRSSCSPAATSPRSACRRVVPAVALARERVPACAARSSATGRSARRCSRAIERSGSAAWSRRPASSTHAVIEEALRTRAVPGAALARARATASSVVEAAARGTPSVVVAGPDNAAVELVVEEARTGSSPRAPAPEDPRRRDRPRVGGRARAARLVHAPGSPATRPGSRSTASLEPASSRPTPRSRRRPLGLSGSTAFRLRRRLLPEADSGVDGLRRRRRQSRQTAAAARHPPARRPRAALTSRETTASPTTTARLRDQGAGCRRAAEDSVAAQEATPREKPRLVALPGRTQAHGAPSPDGRRPRRRRRPPSQPATRRRKARSRSSRVDEDSLVETAGGLPGRTTVRRCSARRAP